MSEHSGEERRGQTKAVMERILSERKQMLVLFEKVAGVAPYTEAKPDMGLLKEFSQILVDYIAAGHFSLYERIAEGKERRRRVIELARELFPQLMATTDVVVAFNDAYDEADESGQYEPLLDRIPALGENLALRVDLEDRLLSAMM